MALEMKTSRKREWACNIEIIGMERLVVGRRVGAIQQHGQEVEQKRTSEHFLWANQGAVCDRQKQGAVKGVCGPQGA